MQSPHSTPKMSLPETKVAAPAETEVPKQSDVPAVEPVAPLVSESEPITEKSTSQDQPILEKEPQPETQDSIEKSEVTLPVPDELKAETDPEHEDLLSQLEAKVSSLWTMAAQKTDRESLAEVKQDILLQLASAKESLVTNQALQSNVHFAESKLKELTDKVKNTDVGLNFETVSTQANKALDTLDSKLEIVEQQALKFVSLLTSFFSSMVVVDAPKEEPKEVPGSFSSLLAASYGNSRFDTELRKLHTTESYYLSSDLDNEKELAAFDVNDRTDDIAALLSKYSATLEPLMNLLVPVQISYSLFWYRYFKQEQLLKQQEEARKSLLSSGREAPKGDANSKPLVTQEDDEDDDDFTWDDDEDEA